MDPSNIVPADAIALFRGDPRIAAVYLHGSYARGEARPDSDVDLAVLPTAGITFTDYDRAVLAGEVSLVIGKDADIGELSSRNLVYAKEAIYTGTLVYSRDEHYSSLMSMSLLSMYASFNEERKEVLNAWRA